MKPNEAGIRWRTPQGDLRVFEPNPAEVLQHAGALAAAYNEPYNRSMMGHAEMSETDVITHFANMREDGARLFLLECDGRLAGDADFRHIDKVQAEYAVMIGGRSAQGKGFGTRFSIMLHAYAFKKMKLKRVFITVLEKNTPSRKLFLKLGYEVDHSPEIRAHIDQDSDIGMSIERFDFERIHAAALREIVVK